MQLWKGAMSNHAGVRLHICAQTSGSAVIVHCAGDILYRHEADQFVDFVTQFVHRDVVIDLQHVSSVDAYGLGRLLHVREGVVAGGQRLFIVNPSERVRFLFVLAKLDFLFVCACDERLG